MPEEPVVGSSTHHRIAASEQSAHTDAGNGLFVCTQRACDLVDMEGHRRLHQVITFNLGYCVSPVVVNFRTSITHQTSPASLLVCAAAAATEHHAQLTGLRGHLQSVQDEFLPAKAKQQSQNSAPSSADTMCSSCVSSPGQLGTQPRLAPLSIMWIMRQLSDRCYKLPMIHIYIYICIPLDETSQCSA